MGSNKFPACLSTTGGGCCYESVSFPRQMDRLADHCRSYRLGHCKDNRGPTLMGRGKLFWLKERTFEVNPLTGGYGKSCSNFPLVPIDEGPTFKREAIFKAVFGRMERLRILESQKCTAKRIEKDRKTRAKWQLANHLRNLSFGYKWACMIGERKPKGPRKIL